MIYHIRPFATDKTKFGEVYNAHVAMIPNEEDWVLLMDWDTMMLTARQFQVIENAIQRYPDTDIFGAMTNRVAYDHQRHTFNMDETDSIKHHIRIANALSAAHFDGECADAKTVAGFFMLFKKKYWTKTRFTDTIIDEHGNLFDYNFCKPAKKVRVIMGVYVYHQYRIMQDNWKRKDHLKIPR